MVQVTAVDVTVRGGGIFGLCTAWACARPGARVRLVERRAIGAGSSGGIVGALAPHVPENWNDKKAFQLDSLLMAEGYWAEIETVSGLSTGYGRLGRLQPLADGHAVEMARARSAGAARLWQDRARWEVVEARDFPDWAPPSATGLLIHDTLSARLHPRLACLALAAACRARGVEIVIGDAPDAGAPDSGAVVWATGYEGLEELSRTLGKPVGNGVKGQAVLLGFDASDKPQLYADGLHIVPHGNGTVAIGSTSEREFEAPDMTDAQCDALLARARAACPPLGTAPVRERWAGVRPRAKSRAPMLGPWPGRPGHFIANGGFKIGFGMAPKAAEAMADLIVENRDTLPDGFRVEASL